MWGIDVSHHQGVINWIEVRLAGVQFAIMKAMYERSHQVDNRFEYNYYQSGANNLERGVYIYVIATDAQQATQEANDFLGILKGRALERGIWLDIEDSRIRGLSKAQLTEIIETEANIFKSAGYQVGVYSNLDWYLRVLDGDALIKKYKWWIARYPKNDDGTIKLVLRPNNSFAIWQYSSKGSVPGITGPVDMDIETSDLGHSVEEIAQQVLSGYWGNGQVRCNRITAAGYNFTLVQQMVNRLLHNKTYYPKYEGLSLRIDEIFRKIGVETEYIGNKDNRRPVAYANGIVDYSGSLLQNLKLISLAKAGELKRP